MFVPKIKKVIEFDTYIQNLVFSKSYFVNFSCLKILSDKWSAILYQIGGTKAAPVAYGKVKGNWGIFSFSSSEV